jgi:hypothetical protein
MPPLDEPGALQQLAVPGWYYPLARRAPWVLRALFAALAGLARRKPTRAERILLSDMSEPDRRLLGRPGFAGRFGADLAGAGGRGVVDDERLMPLPWGFEPERVEGPVRLWLGERDGLVQRTYGSSDPGRSRSATRPSYPAPATSLSRSTWPRSSARSDLTGAPW